MGRLLLLLLLACTKPAPPSGECTLETPLMPGVPGSPGHLIQSTLNPNGASALAALMRQFVTDWQTAKAALDGGLAQSPLSLRHQRMRCVWPTDPADRNAAFDAMAQHYLQQVKAFDATPGPETYAAAIASCTACHEGTCPGPLAIIEKLR
jgi:hypothetical protein